MMLALRNAPRLFGWGTRTDAGGGFSGALAPSFEVAVGEERPPRIGPAAHGTHSMDSRATEFMGGEFKGGDTQPERARFGPYRLLRTLDACPGADRLLALHEKRQTSHVVYRFGVFHDAAERRRFMAAVEPLARLEHAHLLPVEEYSFAADGRGWVVTPYTGSQIGLMTLSRLLADKGGRMAPSEVERAMTHTLEASAAAHAVGLVHGAISPDEVLIDRRGSASVELYGLSRRMQPEKGREGVDQARAGEARSVVELGYRLLTGMPAAAPHIAPSRLVKRLDRRWDSFFAAGLNGAFVTPDAALSAMRGGVGAGVEAASTRATASRRAPLIRATGADQ